MEWPPSCSLIHFSQVNQPELARKSWTHVVQWLRQAPVLQVVPIPCGAHRHPAVGVVAARRLPRNHSHVAGLALRGPAHPHQASPSA
ncbi:hypothetical protein NDU88_003791 [Pleurodeles waltl]|uniref:Uncharacterized protein n=1 Tax=Pleurodeles waltl TaxID=8319 RepID=A0AAV7T5Z0_PLEWA|nr:hypothetical protein NDU88_003791 [Pleurodeles waltl]